MSIKSQQITDTVLMIAPTRFGFNPDAAQSNSFMESDDALSPSERAAIQAAAAREFKGFADALRAAGVEVLEIADTDEPRTPDSIFPNNWISTHADGRIILYPMEPENRRLERRADIVAELANRFGYRSTLDLSPFEDEGLFLEGTGSLVLDRANGVAYANRSSRMRSEVLCAFAKETGFTPVEFTARRRDGGQIYHTNVLMAVGEDAAVVCAECIPDPEERETVLASLRRFQGTVVEITEEQMDNFAGNLLQLRNRAGERLWAMSARALAALLPEQRQALTANGARIVSAPLDAIERYGGGSARCMLAEIFVPQQD